MKTIQKLKRQIMSMKKNHKRLIPVFAITIGIFIFLFYNVPISDVFNSMRKTNLGILSLAFCISGVSNILLSSYRWKLILQQINCPITFRESLFIKMGSDSMIGSLPLRAGESFRILYLRRIQKIPYTKSILSILAEYSLNIISLLFFVLLGSILYWLGSSGKGIISAKSIVASIVLFSPLSIVKKLNQLKYKLRGFFNDYLKSGAKELRFVLSSKRILFCTFFFSASSLVNVYLISMAVGFSIPLYKILIFVPAVILITSVPVTFLGTGIRESAFLYLFAEYASPGRLLSLGILFSFVEYLFPMIVGSSLTGALLGRLFWKQNKFN